MATTVSAHMHEPTAIMDVESLTVISQSLIDQHQADNPYWPTKVVSMLKSRGIEITEDKLNAFFVESK